jgi:hypothetical protein
LQFKSFQPTRQGLLALCAVAVLFALFGLRGAPLGLDPVRGANSPEQFDTARAIGRLDKIIGDGKPHPVDSAALEIVRTRLLAEIRALGFAPEVRTHDACRSMGAVTRCARVSNIVFRTGPENGRALMLTAHYDSVDDSPGAGDDGVGVAVWLEVARHLADAPPSRPVFFLFTDGEEAALLGAQAFSDNFPDYKVDIDRIINLEARGNRGPAMMFETSHPNATVVGDWARNTTRPVSSSLMTAVYELLPNSTDLTIHLHDRRAGINIAIADGLAFYHTELDDLAHLDLRSVQHMGDQALGATRAWLAASGGSRGEIVYTDVLARMLVSLPTVPALVLLGLCLGLAALLMSRPTREADWRVFDWRSFAIGPCLLVSAGVLAWVGQVVVGLLRPEPAYWTAYPGVLNAAVFLLAGLAAVALLAFVARTATRAALFATGWFWFLAVGVGLAFVVPGVAMIFLVPGIAFVAAAVVARFAPRVATIAHAVAAAVALMLVLPLIHLFDIMMGLALAPAFGVLAGLALLPALCLVGPIAERPIAPVVVTAVAGIAALVVAAVVPAYSRETPLSLDVFAHYDIDARTASVAASAPTGALPSAMRAALPAKPTAVLPGIAAPMAHTDLPFRAWRNARLQLLTDTTSGDIRTVTLRLADTSNVIATDNGNDFTDVAPAEAAGSPNPAARFIRIRIPAAANPLRLTYLPNGRVFPMVKALNGYFVFDCVGRSCDGAELKVELKAPVNGPAAPEWTVQGFLTGLPPEAAAVARLRPDWAIQIGTGDATVVTRKFRLP